MLCQNIYRPATATIEIIYTCEYIIFMFPNMHILYFECIICFCVIIVIIMITIVIIAISNSCCIGYTVMNLCQRCPKITNMWHQEIILSSLG